MCGVPRCLDILELSEDDGLRKFHYHTLKLYCALCALGNTRVAHTLCSHMDQSQLLYTIDNQYLSGMLREGFYNVLIRFVALSHWSDLLPHRVLFYQSAHMADDVHREKRIMLHSHGSRETGETMANRTHVTCFCGGRR